MAPEAHGVLQVNGQGRLANGHEKQQGVDLKRAGVLSFCVAGIWVAYLTQGLLQENLSTKKFGPDGKRFEHLPFLNLAQSIVCFLWAFAGVQLFSRGVKKPGRPPLTAYWLPSISNAVGPALGIEALRYISYPAQVLAKSSKMIPVMIMGALVYQVRYSASEYICTVLVAGGVAVFALFKSSGKVLKKIAHPNAPLGYFLCFLNLVLDGFTNSTQDNVKLRYQATTSLDLMLGMNFWCSIYMSLYMFLVPNGGGFEAIHFCQQHPEAAWDVLVFCLCGAVGQGFIFLTINEFGTLANTTITTTRKFMSILLSTIWNKNPMTAEQWAGVFMVFGGLTYSIYLKWQRSKAKKAKAAKEVDKAK